MLTVHAIMVSLFVLIGQNEVVDLKFDQQPSMASCASARQQKIDAMRAAGETSKYRSYQILCIETHTQDTFNVFRFKP